MSRVMKDSGYGWIGEIPVNWKISQVKRLFSIGRGRVIATTELKETGFPVYSSQTKNNGVLGYLDTYDFDRSQLTWTTDGANAGTVFLREGKHNCTNVCGTLMPKDDSNDLRYLCYALAYIAFYHKRADINGYKIMNNEMAGIEMILPPISEQKQIADFLDNKCEQIDAVLERTRSSIEEYKKLKQAVISDAVTKGVRQNRQMKDSGIEWIGDIASDWQVIKLKAMIRAIDSGTSVNAAQYPASEKEIGVLKTSCVSKFAFIPSENKAVNEDEISRVSCPVKANTIIMSRMNTPDLVGACGFVECDYPNLYLPDRLWRVSFANGTNVKFFWYFLNSSQVRSYYGSLAVGTSSSMQNISQDQFYHTYASLPNKEEQDEIVSYLDTKIEALDKLIHDKETLLSELESYKKALIFEYVTGKKEVPA